MVDVSDGMRLGREASSARSGLLTIIRARAGKLTKTAIGLALLGLAGWQADRTFIKTLSTDATVAGEFFVVASPIDGYLDLAKIEVGDIIEPQQVVGGVTNPFVDRSRVAQIRSRLTTVDGELAATRELIARLDALGSRHQKRGALSQTMRVQRLGIDEQRLSARADGDRARFEEAQLRLQRAETLLHEGLVPTQAVEELRRDQTVLQKTYEAAQSELLALRSTAKSLQDGVILDSFSSSDRSYSAQRVDEIEVRLTQADSDRRRQETEHEALSKQLDTEEAQLRSLSDSALSVTVRGRVLERFSAPNEFVHRGQNILRVVDCRKLFVRATVDRRRFSRLRIGTKATIKLLSSGLSFPGQVSLLLGAPEGRTADAVTAGLPATSRDRFIVLVRSSEMATAISAACEIGGPAEVEFH